MRFIVLVFALVLLSCSTSKKATQAIIPDEIVNLDNLEVVPEDQEEAVAAEDSTIEPLPEYKPSYSREIDLLHTKLEVSFDWAKEQVLGKAALVFKPYGYDINRFRLDAKNFIINSVKIGNTNLTYNYDDTNLYINLDKTYTPNDEVTIVIDYIARPSEFPAGSSAAITSEKGLFFIDPKNEDPDKPTQIWTQGEAENNSRWFPTIDRPNERCTQELYITVDKKYKTLSNGLLVSSKVNTDGTRTDYWKMDLPHAPYLFMMAIGEYAVVKDQWKDIPLEYYTEPEYEKDAKLIYNHTPEMLEFFSNTFGLKYPWPKLSQIVVRDYVSGAMENTTAIIYGEFIQRHADELEENPNDYILAHEISHHWFGDYVTCESWANLTLNEGFANYSEYLWFEHKYGKDEAELHRLNELDGYMASAQYNVHPLIHYHYNEKTDMFDAHSYNKGGLVLHMLRNMLGDKVFFKALKNYLAKNAFTAVEVHNLRMAFEDASGQDLNWFFDQWYNASGHPKLEYYKSYDETSEEVVIDVIQTQSQADVPKVFRFPLAVYITDQSGNKVKYERWVNERNQQYRFKVPAKPLLVEIDPEKIILCERTDYGEDTILTHLYNPTSPALARYDAIDKIAQAIDGGQDEYRTVMGIAINDPLEAIRAAAVVRCDPNQAGIMDKIKALANNDPKEEVRSAAASFIGENNPELFRSMANELLTKGTEAQKARMLLLVHQFLTEKAMEYAEKFEKNASEAMLTSLAKLYADAGKTEKLSIIENGMSKLDDYTLISYTGNYATLLAKSDAAKARTGFDKLYAQGMNAESKIKRFAAVLGFFQVYVLDAMAKQELEPTGFNIDMDYIKSKMGEMISNEKDPELQNAYKRFKLE